MWYSALRWGGALECRSAYSMSGAGRVTFIRHDTGFGCRQLALMVMCLSLPPSGPHCRFHSCSLQHVEAQVTSIISLYRSTR